MRLEHMRIRLAFGTSALAALGIFACSASEANDVASNTGGGGGSGAVAGGAGGSSGTLGDAPFGGSGGSTPTFGVSSLSLKTGWMSGGDYVTLSGGGFAKRLKVFIGDGRAPA